MLVHSTSTAQVQTRTQHLYTTPKAPAQVTQLDHLMQVEVWSKSQSDPQLEDQLGCASRGGTLLEVKV